VAPRAARRDATAWRGEASRSISAPGEFFFHPCGFIQLAWLQPAAVARVAAGDLRRAGRLRAHGGSISIHDGRRSSPTIWLSSSLLASAPTCSLKRLQWWPQTGRHPAGWPPCTVRCRQIRSYTRCPSPPSSAPTSWTSTALPAPLRATLVSDCPTLL
jgi:hypothetical protein